MLIEFFESCLVFSWKVGTAIARGVVVLDLVAGVTKIANRVQNGCNWLAIPRPEVLRSNGESRGSNPDGVFERLGTLAVCCRAKYFRKALATG